MSIKYHILRLAVAALFALQLSCCAGSDKKPSYLDTSAPIDARVDDLLGRMTAEEKISMLRTLAPPIERLGIDKYYRFTFGSMPRSQIRWVMSMRRCPSTL